MWGGGGGLHRTFHGLTAGTCFVFGCYATVARSCGCFGQLEVPRALLLTFDFASSAVFAYAVVVNAAVMSPQTVLGVHRRVAVALACLLSAGVVALGADGGATRLGHSPRVFNPETWVGGPCPFAPNHLVSPGVSRQAVLVYRSGCSDCGEVVKILAREHRQCFLVDLDDLSELWVGKVPVLALLEGQVVREVYVGRDSVFDRIVESGPKRRKP